jgi:NTE family protein
MIQSLIFEGGGVKGIGHIGALKELQKMGKLNNVTRYAGTSIGGVLACILSMGMSVDELEARVQALDILSIRESDWFFVKIYNLLFRGGLHENVKLRRWFREFIIDCGFEDTTTLKEHFDYTKRELVVCSTKINKQEPLYIHHATTPDITLLDAMCMTANFPCYYTPHKMGKDTYIDGGICDNYPFWIFNDIPKLYEGNFLEIDKSYMDKNSLGMKVLSPHESNSVRLYTGNDRMRSTADVMLGIMNTLFTQVEREEISESCVSSTIGIHTGGVSPLDFTIGKIKKDLLIVSGEIAAKLYFEKANGYNEYV